MNHAAAPLPPPLPLPNRSLFSSQRKSYVAGFLLLGFVDTRAQADRHQLLQVPRPGGSLAPVQRGGREQRERRQHQARVQAELAASAASAATAAFCNKTIGDNGRASSSLLGLAVY